MGQNSVFDPKTWNPLSWNSGGENAFQQAINGGNPSNINPPSLSGAIEDSLNAELLQEQNMRASQTLFTGGMGTTAAAPTASQVLRGK